MTTGILNLDFVPDSWDTHRTTITRLYVDEKMTLKEVMAIMERDYHFSKRFVGLADTHAY